MNKHDIHLRETLRLRNAQRVLKWLVKRLERGNTPFKDLRTQAELERYRKVEQRRWAARWIVRDIRQRIASDTERFINSQTCALIRPQALKD